MKRVLLLLALLSIGVGLEARVIVVDDDGTGDYLTIQEGVAAADSGDTVFVKNGLYDISWESLDLDEPIWLLGESMDSTIVSIYGGPHQVGIVVKVEGCTISGFKMSGAQYKNYAPWGVNCIGTSPTITYNTFVEEGQAMMDAVICEGTSSPAVHYNNFYSWYGVSLWWDGSLNVNAENNYWGTTDTAEINSKIFDGNDWPGLGVVDYTPYLQEPVSIGENNNLSLPSGFSKFNPLYPNPFSTTTTISYQISARSKVSLNVYDITGREIKRLVDGVQERGKYHLQLDMTGYAEGVYFCRLETNGYHATKKIVRVR